MQTAPAGSGPLYRTALVTGASSGIGRAVAARLAGDGMTVYGTSRRADAAGLDPRIRWLGFDGATPGGISAFLEQHADLLTTIDLLVNNAGSACFGTVDALPEAALAEQSSLLLAAPVALLRAVLPGMRGRGRGAIVNISSLAALFPLPYLAAYSAGKAGLSAFTESLMLTEAGGGVVLIDFKAGDYRTGFNAGMARHGAPDARQARAWGRLEANLQAGPGPERAADDLLRALRRGRSGTVYSGGFFQARLAPLGARLLPRRLVLAAIRRYYHLGGP